MLQLQGNGPAGTNCSMCAIIVSILAIPRDNVLADIPAGNVGEDITLFLQRPRQPHQQSPNSQRQENHNTQNQTPSTNTTLTSLIPNGTSLLCSFRAILEVEGRVQAVRGIIDTGSTMSFLARRIAYNLKVKRIPFNASVTGLAQSHATTSNAKVCVTVKSAEMPSECSFSLTAALLNLSQGILPQIICHKTEITTSQNVTSQNVSH